MRRRRVLPGFALVCTLVAVSARGAEPARLLEGFGRTHAFIETHRTCQLLEIYVAVTPQQRAQGLMFVRELGEFEGMLFPSSAPEAVSMWMKNTFIPLDMLFIRADGKLAGLAANTRPFSEDIIQSAEPVTAVLELNGGFAARHGVRKGDRFRVYD